MILADNTNKKQQDKAAYLSSNSAELLVEINELTRVVESKSEVITAQKKRIDILEEALRLSKIKRFAPSSEQSQQTSLFDEAENEIDSEEVDLEEADDLDAATDEFSEDDQADTLPKTKKKPGRKPFSDILPREQIYIYLTDEEKQGSIVTVF